MAGTQGRDPWWLPVGAAEDPADHPSRAWSTYDAEEIRPYAITGGRTRPQHPMRLVTLLEAADTARVQGAAPEAAQAVEACRVQPCSVAEIAALIGLPVQVTKIILSDLIDCGALVVALPGPSDRPDHLQLLEALRSGIETRLSDVA
ncbi:DUF742 domain-containing protein [Spirillospora sp. NPDC048819]|uniref:DUF742 domain-containing protein n=1 Tax=Spirillospora sp. NPDC048819 TaxID=3155268 RepID=UPI0033E9FBE3